MKIIEIAALSNGAHRNQTYHGAVPEGRVIVPDGWAVIPDGMTIPATFPFVDVVVADVPHYEDVEVMRDVAKSREVQYFDGDGNPVMVTEEYTEPELVTEQQEYTVKTVIAMTEGVVPEPTPEPTPEPSAAEDTAAMLVDHEYRLTLLELGLTEE